MPLREASSSLSIDLDLDHELLELLSPEHSHGTSLSSLTASPVTNCRSSRPNYTGTFQCHSPSEDANFRDRSSDGSGRGSRSSGCPAVVVVSLFALLVLCGAKTTPDGGFVSCSSVASHLPARIPTAGSVGAMGSVVLPASGRCGSTSVIRASRPAAVVWRPRKKSGFS